MPRSSAVDTWNENDVIDFLVDEGLLGSVSIGLVNGNQFSLMTLQTCENAVNAGHDIKLVGQRLYSSVEKAKRGCGASSSSSSTMNAPSSVRANKDLAGYPSDEYHRLEEIVFDEDHDLKGDRAVVDPDSHKFPPLCERPSTLSAVAICTVTLVCVLCCTILKKPLADAFGVCEDHFMNEFLRWASIPVLMAPFTYAHIYMCLWMTFFPMKFVGCCQIPGTNVGFPLGWQGIVPYKCVEMARMAVKMMTEKLLKVEEVFARLDTHEFAEMLKPTISKRMTQIVNEIAKEEAPRMWAMLPVAVKEHIYKEAAKNSPEVVSGMVAEMQERIDDCFDLEGLVVRMMSENLELSNNMFISCSDAELAFLRNSGAWMGFIFGIVQIAFMQIPGARETTWVLPLVGALAGGITNALALMAIFYPVNPVNMCGYKVQGLFLTRQHHVSALYGQIVQGRILTAHNLAKELMLGARSDVTREISKKHIRAAFEKSVTLLRSGPLSLTMPVSVQDALDRISNSIADSMAKDMYSIMAEGEDFMDKSFDLNNTLRTRMRKLPPQDFERLLHPIFEEDEPKLIVVGAVLGLIFGIGQVAILGF